MKRHARNTRLTSPRQQRMKYFVEVNKRGGKERWERIAKLSAFAFKLLFLGAIFCGLYIGGTRGWKKLFWENPNYFLKEISYNTDGSLSRDQALAVAGLRPGNNIFSYNLDRCRDTLRKLPQIQQVVVRRYLPNRIELQVSERRPVAWLLRKPDDALVSNTSLMLDARGLVFKPKRVLPEQEVLPVIYGVETGDLIPGSPVISAEMLASLEALRTTSDHSVLHIKCIDVSKGYCIIAHDQNRRKITFGLDDIPAQLERFKLIAAEATRMGQEIESINLMPERNIPVLFVSSTPVPDTAELEVMDIPKAEVIKLPAKPLPSRTKSESPKPTKSTKPPGAKPVVKKPFRVHA